MLCLRRFPPPLFSCVCVWEVGVRETASNVIAGVEGGGSYDNTRTALAGRLLGKTEGHEARLPPGGETGNCVQCTYLAAPVKEMGASKVSIPNHNSSTDQNLFVPVKLQFRWT